MDVTVAIVSTFVYICIIFAWTVAYLQDTDHNVYEVNGKVS